MRGRQRLSKRLPEFRGSTRSPEAAFLLVVLSRCAALSRRVKAGDFDLGRMLAILEAKAVAVDAKRIVFDGIEVLLGLLDNEPKERHLSYVVQDGERNRTLTIVKSRGTGHSNQVRELPLSDEAVSLTDVFMAQGKALMGVARWEWDQEVLRKLRHGDAEPIKARIADKAAGRKRNHHAKTH